MGSSNSIDGINDGSNQIVVSFDDGSTGKVGNINDIMTKRIYIRNGDDNRSTGKMDNVNGVPTQSVVSIGDDGSTGKVDNINDAMSKSVYIQDGGGDEQHSLSNKQIDISNQQTSYEQQGVSNQQTEYTQQGVSNEPEDKCSRQLRDLDYFKKYVTTKSEITTKKLAQFISKPFEIRLRFDPSYKVFYNDVLNLSNKAASRFTIDAAGHLYDYDSGKRCFAAIINDDNIRNTYVMRYDIKNANVEKFTELFQMFEGPVVQSASTDEPNKMIVGTDPSVMAKIAAIRQAEQHTSSAEQSVSSSNDQHASSAEQMRTMTIDELKKALNNNSLNVASEFSYENNMIKLHEAPKHVLSVFREDVPNIKELLFNNDKPVPLSVINPDTTKLSSEDIKPFCEFDIVEVEQFSSPTFESVNIFKILLFVLISVCFGFIIYHMYRDYYKGVKLSNGGFR